MRLRRLVAGSLAAFLAATCNEHAGTVDPPAPPAPTGTIVGQVTVEGAGLAGILVSLTGAASQSTATGADGSFQFVSVPAGSHVVTLSSGVPSDAVFSRTTLSVTISSPGQQVRADFSGQYLRTSSISGAVLAVSAGTEPEPVEGFALHLSGVQEASDTTDASGRYEFVALRAGEYTVSLTTREGYVFDATNFAVALPAGQLYRHDFVGAKDLFIATDSLGVGRVSVPFSVRLTARGGASEDFVWSLDTGSRLPRGLTLDSDGTLRGTPVEVGVTEFGVRVTDPAMKQATATLSLRVCEGPIGLEEGDYQIYNRAGLGPCGFYIQAPEAGTYYRVTMVETDAEYRGLYDVEMSVDGTPATPPAAVVANATRPGGRMGQEAKVPASDGWQELLEEEGSYSRAHVLLRQREAELYRRLLAQGDIDMLPDRSRETQAARNAGRARAAPEELEFRIGNPFGEGNSCGVDTTVTARLVAENEYLAVYEYATSTASENMQRVIDFYADHGAEVIERYFGGVSDVNGDGLVNLLIRPELEGSTRAYVWSADMTLSQSSCAASNEMELMHVDAGAIDRISENDYFVLGTVVHEMKHVSSLYKRFRRRGTGSPFHPDWIEEGTADLAKEVASRLAWQRAGGPELTDRVNRPLLRAAVRETSDTRDEAYGVFFSMARVVWAFSPDSSAVTQQYGEGEVGDIYGSGWHFHRFLMDWIAGGGTAGEELMRELNDSLTISGVAGIEAVTGRPMDELLTEHAVAMTFAGSEDVLVDGAPRFTTYDFSTATEVFNNPDPPGFYPWPVTTTGEDTDDAFAPVSVPLAIAETRDFNGRLAASGVRFHDFRAGRTGDAAAFYVDIPGSARVIVARIPDPDPPGS